MDILQYVLSLIFFIQVFAATPDHVHAFHHEQPRAGRTWDDGQQPAPAPASTGIGFDAAGKRKQQWKEVNEALRFKSSC